MITLKKIKNILYKELPSINNKEFLKTFFPKTLYDNENPQFNTGLDKDDYQDIASWLSHLMNGKTSEKDNSSVKSGVERVRNQMICIIRDNDDIFFAIESNCKNFIEKNSINKNIFYELVENEEISDSSLKEHFYKCLKLYPAHGLTLLLLYALLPNHVDTLCHLDGWKKSSFLAPISCEQKMYVISLQQDLRTLIDILKKSYGMVKDNDDSYLNLMENFESSLEHHIFELPSDIYQQFKSLFKISNDIYFQLYKFPDSPCSYSTTFAYQLKKLIQLENAYNSFLQELTERIID